MELHEKVYGNQPQVDQREILFVHGIFGAGRNWASIARDLVQDKRLGGRWRARCIDLPSHGRSPEAPLDGYTVEAMARALAHHLDSAPEIVLGHSFGGAVAMAYGQSLGDEKSPEQLWVIDTSPAAVAPGGPAWQMIDLVRKLPQQFPSRQVGVEQLITAGLRPAVAQWMGMNLVKTSSGESTVWQWRFHWEKMIDLLADFFQLDQWTIVEQPTKNMSLHWVHAEDSTAILPGDVQRLNSLADQSEILSVHTVASGHWVNVEAPEKLIELLVRQMMGQSR